MRSERERRWAERVAAWRKTSLISVEFSRGRDFTVGGSGWRESCAFGGPAMVGRLPACPGAARA